MLRWSRALFSKSSSCPNMSTAMNGLLLMVISAIFVLKFLYQLSASTDIFQKQIVFDFFNHITAFYATISDFCTSKDCAVMTGGPGVEYQWMDAQKRTSKVSAPQYFDFTATWIQSVLNDDQQFPTKSAVAFPKEHINTVKTVFKHLFRIFVHIYHTHYDKIVHLNAEAHLNTLFANFACFSKEFDLLDKKELEPLRELITDLESLGLC